jgi:hypothetical protein
VSTRDGYSAEAKKPVYGRPFTGQNSSLRDFNPLFTEPKRNQKGLNTGNTIYVFGNISVFEFNMFLEILLYWISLCHMG